MEPFEFLSTNVVMIVLLQFGKIHEQFLVSENAWFYFPENLFFSKEKNRTPLINEAVRLILNTSKGFGQQKNRATIQTIDVVR